MRHILAVGSGKGGVGKTTVAVNLAIALSRFGHRVGLLDADVYGPNVPRMMGLDEPAYGEGQLIVPLERDGVKVLSLGFLNRDKDRPVIWRGPMLHSIMNQFLRGTAWGELDFLVVDMPPGTGDVALSLSQGVAVTGALVVTTPSDVALEDARKAVNMFRTLRIAVLGVVENMSYLVVPQTGERMDVFGTGGGQRMAGELGVDFLGELPLDPVIRVGGDSGQAVAWQDHAGFSELARRVLDRVEEVSAAAAPTMTIED